MKRAWLVLLLSSSFACGDDAPVDGDPDSGMVADLGPSVADAALDEDLGTEPLCDTASCINGTCVADVCRCDAGWTGAACDALDEPTESNLLLWFDADQADTLTIGDSNQIDAWEARFAVGGGATVVPLADGQRPRFQPGTSTWGRGALGFDGVDDKLVQEGLWPGLAGRTEYTVAGVYTHGTMDSTAFVMASPAGDPGFGIGTGPLSLQILALATDGMGGAQVLLESEADGVPSGGIQIVVLRVSAGGASLRVNGTQVDRTLSSPTLELPASEIVFGGASVDGTERVYAGAIGEVLVFGEALSDERLTDLEGYLQAKWQSM